MIDQLYDRNYQAARATFNADIDRSLRALSKAVGNTFRAIHRVQFAAPWHERRAPGRCR